MLEKVSNKKEVDSKCYTFVGGSCWGVEAVTLYLDLYKPQTQHYKDDAGKDISWWATAGEIVSWGEKSSEIIYKRQCSNPALCVHSVAVIMLHAIVVCNCCVADLQNPHQYLLQELLFLSVLEKNLHLSKSGRCLNGLFIETKNQPHLKCELLAVIR